MIHNTNSPILQSDKLQECRSQHSQLSLALLKEAGPFFTDLLDFQATYKLYAEVLY